MAFDRLWPRLGKLALGLLAFNAASHVMMPGLNLSVFQQYVRSTTGSLLWLYDKIGGGGLSRVSIVALGFMPYLSARVFMWLARTVSPGLKRLGESASGQKTLKRWTRGLTVGLSLVQSYGLAQNLLNVPQLVLDPGPGFVMRLMGVLTGGAIVAMMLSESVEDIAADSLGSTSTTEDNALTAKPQDTLTAGAAQPIDVTGREVRQAIERD